MTHSRYTYISVANHIVSDDIQSELVSDLTKLFGHVLSHHPSIKRSPLTDALSSLGSGLANFFQPHVQAVQKVVFYTKCDCMHSQRSVRYKSHWHIPLFFIQIGCRFGETLTAASAFHTSLTTGTDEIATLDSSSALAQHGQNALSALKDAVTDILRKP